MNISDVAGVGLEGSNEHVVGNWSKGGSLLCGGRTPRENAPK